MQIPEFPATLTPKEAISLQKQLRENLLIEDRFSSPEIVAGIDVAFLENGEMTRASVALLHFPSMELISLDVAVIKTTMPYIPGLLSFREIPAILEVLKKIPTIPDMLFCDGQGIAHPRRMGIAAHLGLLLDIPSIGIAKKRLTGTYEMPEEEKGARSPLFDKEQLIGTVLRSKEGIKPLFVSPGHRVSIATATELVLQCCFKHKLPEPTRWADKAASHMKDELLP